MGEKQIDAITYFKEQLRHLTGEKTNFSLPTLPAKEAIENDANNLKIILDLIQEQQKVIDMIVEDIRDNGIGEDICGQFKMKNDCYKDNTYKEEDCKKCIIDYYFKKAIREKR